MIRRVVRFGFGGRSQAAFAIVLAWHMSGSTARAHAPEGSYALIFWVFFGGLSLLPLLTTLALSYRLHTRGDVPARSRALLMSAGAALVNVFIGAGLLHFLLGELHRPRLGPEPRVAWGLTVTPMAIVIAAAQVAAGLLATGHVLWLARGKPRRPPD